MILVLPVYCAYVFWFSCVCPPLKFFTEAMHGFLVAGSMRTCCITAVGGSSIEKATFHSSMCSPTGNTDSPHEVIPSSSLLLFKPNAVLVPALGSVRI